MVRPRYLSSALIAGVLLAGCGGGDDGGDAPAPAPPVEAALTEAELISEGDRICAEVNAAIGTINASEATDETSKEAQRGDIYLGLADRLDDLGEPSDGAAPTAVIAAARDLADSGGDTTALTAFQEAAEEYGLTECAEEPVAPTGTPGLGDDEGGSGSSTPTPAPAPAPAPAPTPAPTPAPDPDGGFSPGGGSSGGGGGSAPSGGISPG